MRLLSRRPEWPSVSHSEIVKRARLLVIDDGEFPFEKLFTRDGYNVKKWDRIENLGELENGNFDLILLDLMGVGSEESLTDGLGLIEHLKERNPSEIVVAYSNSEFSVDAQPFFAQADAVLHKTRDDYVRFKRVVDELLEKRFSYGFYASVLDRELADFGPAATKRARKAIAKRNDDGLRQDLESYGVDLKTVDRVVTVVGIAIKVAGFWSA